MGDDRKASRYRVRSRRVTKVFLIKKTKNDKKTKTWKMPWGMDCLTLARRTSAHHDFVTSANQNWDICSPPSGHLLTKIWDICSPKSGHLLTKFLKFCKPIIKSESVPPWHVKGYIWIWGRGGGARRLSRRSTSWWMGMRPMQ